MESIFIGKWHRIREEKQSNIIAGVDPSVFEIGHGDAGLPRGVDMLEWSLSYINSVAPYVAGVKMNQGFFQGIGQTEVLKKLIAEAQSLDLCVLSDNKIADIGNTNGVWFFYNKTLGFDAVTAAPYAGNIEASIAAGHEKGVAVITMGLMSNPEYATEIKYIDPDSGETIWKNRVRRSLEAKVDGIVVGGTYTKEDSEFMEFIEITNDTDVLYLIPGIGAQGGDVKDFLASGIKPEKCMVNSGRALMFPDGSDSTPKAQAEAAKTLRDLFNTIAYE